MLPTADHIYDATSTFTTRTAPLYPWMRADRAQIAQLDAVEARTIAGSTARWYHLTGMAALSALSALAALLLTFFYVL
jgi:hypothetical protein